VAEVLRGEQAFVDLDRLASNFRATAAFAGRPLLPVVKADAYGHGGSQVARLFESLGAPALAVTFAAEAVALRAAGVRVPILVMAGVSTDEAVLVADHDLTPVVGSARSLEGALSAAALARRPLAVHLKLDTGMARLGFPPAEATAVAERLAAAGIQLQGVMTHLARADDDADACERQLDSFDAALLDLAGHGFRPPWIHAANSAGLLHLRPNQTHARPGLLLYGLQPRPRTPPVDVRPALRLVGTIELVRPVAAGTPVSYGARWVARRSSRVATVAVGYADGVPRTEAMLARGSFNVGGARVPIAGTVCMDFTMLDVSDRPEVREGDSAVVFGDDPTAWDVADWAGTNAWAVLTSVGFRVPRVYLQHGQPKAIVSRY
jgi:alanine racemase